MDKYTDEQLAKLIKQGNKQAFDDLTLRYMGLIRSKSTMYKVEAIDSDDFVQEGLLALLHSVQSYDENAKASFNTYASVCITNRFSSIVRGSHRKKDIPSNMLVPLESQGMSSENTVASPEQDFIDRENYFSVIQHIKNVLSPLEYKVLTYYLSGSSYGDIGDILDLSVKTVDNALQRIRKKLKKGKG
ncbi:MAG TPA: sigma-70 family RNA polymerase sigma factor [Clostridiales bacterium]|nr:sigma-70 family RNA polymerase sigma factor [Clostridiales bacterium]